MNKIFKRIGNELYSYSSGKLVATINPDGTYQLQPGMASYGVKVKVFLAQPEPDDIPEVPEVKAVTAKQEETAESEPVIETNAFLEPETSEGCPFNPELGVNTPGFAEYVRTHNLSETQVVELIKTLSR